MPSKLTDFPCAVKNPRGCGILGGMRLTVGSVVDRYVVEGIVGEGGAATVYAVRHPALGTRHALKVLQHGGAALRQRMLQEARAQSTARHPNLLPVQDVLNLDGQPALLMPLIEGPALDSLLLRHRPSAPAALALLRAITEGLAAAHARQLIHRDLKPGNVLLDLRRGRVQPRISDFGLVKLAAGDLQTQTGSTMGTPAYAAPEQLRDAARVDARADVFSLGVLAAELLCGQRPFAGHSIPELVEAHQQRPRLDGLSGGALRDLVRSMLAMAPGDRPADAAAVLSRLPPADLGGGADPLGASSALFQAALGMKEEVDAGVDSLGFADSAGGSDGAALLEPSFIELAAAAPGSLPPEPGSFVGRGVAVAALRERLAARRLVTVVGPGGIGKTRLAVRLGHAERSGWPGGVWLCDLSEARDAEAVDAAARALLALPPSAQVSEALRARGRALLILDNFEQVVDAAAQTVGAWLAQAPQLRALVTSRQPLRLPGEELFPLGPLDGESAAALFIERARAAGRAPPSSRSARAVIDALVEQLDHLPLAIELAAARARTLPPEQMLQRLRTQGAQAADRLLSSRGGGAPRPARQRTLHATLEWSWALLRPHEQDALAQCSVFEDGLTFEAAEQVIALDPAAPWLEDVLAELVDKSLLVSSAGTQTDQPRLRLLRSVQRFAAGKLTADARDRAEARHGAFFAALGAADALRRLDQRGGAAARRALLEEAANLRVACRRALDRQDVALAAACGDAYGLTCVLQGPVETGVALLRALREALPLPTADRARLLLRAAQLGTALPRAQSQTSALLDEAEALYTQSADPRGRMAVALVRGRDLYILRRDEEARAQFTAARDAARALGDRRAEGMALCGLGELHMRHDAYAESEQDLQAALGCLRGVGDVRQEAEVLGRLVQLNRIQGDIDAALAQGRRALALVREVGDRRGEAQTLSQLSRVLQYAGRLEESLVMGQQALRGAQDIGDPSLTGLMFSRLVGLHRDRGRLDEARLAMEEALAISRAFGKRTEEVLYLNDLAGLEYEDGNYTRSAELLERCLEMRLEMGLHMYAATTHCNLGILLARLDRLPEALEHARQAVTLAEAHGTPLHAVAYYAAFADLLSRDGQFDEALAQIRRGEAALGDRPPDPNRAELMLNLIRVTSLMGDPRQLDDALARAEATIAAIDPEGAGRQRQVLEEMKANLRELGRAQR